MDDSKRLVWDLPLRLFHWLFAALIFCSWGTAELGFSWMKWHMRLGYCMLGMLLFRLIWGVIGPRHARFGSFLKGPRHVLAYVRQLRGAVPFVPSVGHNPLGGLMVLVMLALVARQVVTGLFTTDDIAWAGPFNPSVDSATASYLTQVHHRNFNLILGAIGLHIAAILYYTFVKREKLVQAMLSGSKPAEVVPADQAISSSELWKALLTIVVSVALVYWLLTAAPAAAVSDTFGTD